mmetsp:Transcript_27499/g.49773  ORF Transcript_27499/g.49773 Transcript_27499/m.49773 type:complete len:208 (+) Transcript_27499:281-904(+)
MPGVMATGIMPGAKEVGAACANCCGWPGTYNGTTPGGRPATLTTGAPAACPADAIPSAGAADTPQIFSLTLRARSRTSGSVDSGGSSTMPARNSACCKAKASCAFSFTNAFATSGARRAKRCISPKTCRTCCGVRVSISRAISDRSALSAAAILAFSAASCSCFRAMRSAYVSILGKEAGSSCMGAGPPLPPPFPFRGPSISSLLCP